MKTIFQFFGLIEVTIRDRTRRYYGAYSSTLALNVIFVSIGFALMPVLLLDRNHVLKSMDSRSRAVTYLVGGVVLMVVFGLTYGRTKADALADEARKRWPHLAARAGLVALLYCISAFALFLLTVWWY